MPFDKFFSSQAKRKAAPGLQRMKAAAAIHRRSWPAGNRYERGVALWMKGDGRDWWHFVNVPASTAQDEIAAWRENNPGFEFKMAVENSSK